jgi:hypothetical protein
LSWEHTRFRFTRSREPRRDIDILVRPDPDNAKAVFTALAKFGAQLHGYAPADFAEPGPFFRMGHAPLGVTSSPKYRALILMQHGPAALKMLLTPRAA